MSSKALSASTINENMKKCRYDVRGEIYLAAVKRTEEGKEVIYTNVGNPQALGQVPITFNREVMALLMAPFIMDNPNVVNFIFFICLLRFILIEYSLLLGSYHVFS